MVKHSEARNTVRLIRDLPSKYGMKPAAGLGARPLARELPVSPASAYAECSATEPDRLNPSES